MNTKTRTALRAALKQEDAALAERLPALAAPAAAVEPVKAAVRRTRAAAKPASGSTAGSIPAAARTSAPDPTVGQPVETPAPPSQPAAPDAPRRERFTLGATDWRRLKILREDLGDAGYRPSRSEIVRAALVALSARESAEVLALVRALAPLADEAPSDKPDRSRKGAGDSKPRKRTPEKTASKKKTRAADRPKAGRGKR